MNNEQIIHNIKAICRNKNISVTKLLEGAGVRKSLIYDMEKRNAKPSIEILESIADYLDCSVDYLLGRSNQENVSRETYTLSPLEEELIQSFRKLSPESQYTVAKTVGYCSTLPNVTETTRNDEPEQTQTQIQIAARNGDFITADGDATERKFSTMPLVDDLE